jgi:hypothetical protein
LELDEWQHEVWGGKTGGSNELQRKWVRWGSLLYGWRGREAICKRRSMVAGGCSLNSFRYEVEMEGEGRHSGIDWWRERRWHRRRFSLDITGCGSMMDGGTRCGGGGREGRGGAASWRLGVTQGGPALGRVGLAIRACCENFQRNHSGLTSWTRLKSTRGCRNSFWN